MKLNKLLAAGLAVAVLGVAVAAGTWYFVIRSDSPNAVNLQSALESINSNNGTNSNGSNSPSAAQEAGEQGYAGTWEVVQGTNSFVGYRVGENLVGVGTVTAVGRTNGIEGSLIYDGEAITDVELTADLTTLTSDKSMRDGQLRTQAIETNKFPTATFVLTSPILVDETPADGLAMTQTVEGELTLHGVTRDVEIDVQGQLTGSQLVVVGSTEILFADYGIAQPRSQSVLSIDDFGVMEFQIVFEKSA
jgi:polyisoprenoid-binding protein YceI